MNQFPIVLVDDEKSFLVGFEFIVKRAGFSKVVCFEEATSALEFVRDHEVAGVFVDMIMPAMEGDEFLEKVKTFKPDLLVVMLTALPNPNLIVKCMKLGAYDYLVKPVEKKDLIAIVKRLVDLYQIRKNNIDLKSSHLKVRPLVHPAFKLILTKSTIMNQLFYYTQNIAASHYPVLIRGETGTGKELFAEAVYHLSTYSGSFVAENIASLDPTLFGSTLFGHIKGAFTGAESDRLGLIQQAEDGVLFLDEIGDLDKDSQAKLLRVLQEGEYTPLGSDKKLKVKCRFVFATHHLMEDLMSQGGFRQDLFYRIQAHQLMIPPLRDRPEDLLLLATHFINQFKNDFGLKNLQIAPEFESLLKSYSWPGNVRQLQAACLNAVSQSRKGHLAFDAFHRVISNIIEVKPRAEDLDIPTLKDAEVDLIKRAMDKTSQNQTQAARLLNINRDTLNKKLKKLGL